MLQTGRHDAAMLLKQAGGLARKSKENAMYRYIRPRLAKRGLGWVNFSSDAPDTLVIDSRTWR
jgi:hypothetical protein